MAGYKDKTAKALKPETFERIKQWRRRFTRPFEADEIAVLLKLSEKIDHIWSEHARQLADDRHRTEDALVVWPLTQAQGPVTTTSVKDRVRAKGIFNENSRTASAYRRLKLVMDYWCALWFWPIDQADSLPDRAEFLMEIGLLIHGNVLESGPQQGELELSSDPTRAPEEGREAAGDGIAERHSDYHAAGQQELELPGSQFQMELETSEEPRFSDHLGQLHIERLLEHLPRLRLVEELARHPGFTNQHWTKPDPRLSLIKLTFRT